MPGGACQRLVPERTESVLFAGADPRAPVAGPATLGRETLAPVTGRRSLGPPGHFGSLSSSDAIDRAPHHFEPCGVELLHLVHEVDQGQATKVSA
jgi:hypothetical protein